MQDFSPSFGSLEVCSSSSGVLPDPPAEAVPFPTPPAAVGGDGSCPSCVRCRPGRPEVVLAFPSQPSQPIPNSSTSQLSTLLLLFFCFLHFKKYKVYAPKRGTKNGGYSSVGYCTELLREGPTTTSKGKGKVKTGARKLLPLSGFIPIDSLPVHSHGSIFPVIS